jgi:glycosyltransferase involved in cell wall biosynthesis
MPDDRATPHERAGATVAYLLKGYPRISETFIASEIYRLERLGVPLALFVLKASDETEHHRVVDLIRTVPQYLPASGPITDRRLLPWLADNLRPFLPAVVRVARQRPLGLLRACGLALAQAVRARRRPLDWPRRLYAKELLYAVELADRLLARPDVRHLHAHFAHGCTTVAWLASAVTGVPFSFTGHAKDLYTAELNPAGLLARKTAAARFVVTCTGANGEHLRGLGTTTPVHVIHHGLSSDFTDLTDGTGDRPAPRTPSPTAPLTSAPGLRILGVGRLVPKKGFDTFVRACGVLRDAGVPFSAVIAGEDGPSEPLVRSLVTELGLEGSVSLVGPQTPAELLAHYRSASLMSLACRVGDDGDRDGIPNVLVEAMAAGTPVVSTTVSGIPELIEDGVTGLLVPPDDPAALAAAWRRIADDPALAARLSAAGPAVVAERFDGDRLAARLAELFSASAAPALVGVRR